MRRHDRLGEAQPAAARLEFVRRREQRFARHDVDIDARLAVVEVLAGSGALGAVTLRDLVLLGSELGDRFWGLAVDIHQFRSVDWDSCKWV